MNIEQSKKLSIIDFLWPFLHFTFTEKTKGDRRMQKGLLIYLIVMNLIGLAVMAMDKSKARHHAWRIPEKTLFLVSILGGSVGTWAGMYLFHHKTKHWYFVVGMPAILILQICIAVLIWKTHGFGM